MKMTNQVLSRCVSRGILPDDPRFERIAREISAQIDMDQLKRQRQQHQIRARINPQSQWACGYRAGYSGKKAVWQYPSNFDFSSGYVEGKGDKEMNKPSFFPED